ncbi:MAG: hypothetical protein IPL96_17140 [Holophagaceae bacterium]|nr:hypothetical protein [Holophagaceae bacterium]
MAKLNGRLTLTLVAALLAAGPASAQRATEGKQALAARFAEAATSRLMQNRAEMGLDEAHAFQMQRFHIDELGQTHTRFQKTYQGVKVWGGDLVAHTGPEGESLGLSATHKERVSLNTTPSLSEAEALAGGPPPPASPGALRPPAFGGAGGLPRDGRDPPPGPRPPAGRRTRRR